MAVFYRINAQSRVLEEGMRLSSVPYRVVRGHAFYERSEIKDAAAYLRLAVNPRSDPDLLRVINTPARGIGDTTLDRVRAFAQAQGLTYVEALADPSKIKAVNSSTQRRLAAFGELLTRIAADLAKAPDAHSAVEAMFALTGLVQTHQAEGSEESLERAENLREFLGAAMEFDRLRAIGSPVTQASGPPVDTESGPLKIPQTPLQEFLEQISLLGDADSEGAAGRVSLMTLHAAKGLEFDAVFMTGMEEGVFPHQRATERDAPGFGDPEDMAEERRLCYVGITRARRRLWLTLAKSRALFGEFRRNEPSRFLSDVPKELFESGPPRRVGGPLLHPKGEVWVEREPIVDLDDADGFGDDFDQRSEHERRRAPPRRAAPVQPTVRRHTGAAPAVGTRVRHEQFGEGLVLESSGSGPDARVTVRFPDRGEKRIVARFLIPVG